MTIWQFTCLMVSGVPLTSEVREALYQAAKRIARKSESWGRIQDESCEGRVQTDYSHVLLASASGIKFTAEVDSERGSTKAAFIIPEEVFAIEDDDGTNAVWEPMDQQHTTVAESAWLN